MIPQLWIRQRKDRGRKKHSLVIGMRNEQTDPLVSQFGEPGARHADGIDPRPYQYNRQDEEGEPLHGCGASIWKRLVLESRVLDKVKEGRIKE
jgi:hypothetical protein